MASLAIDKSATAAAAAGVVAYSMASWQGFKVIEYLYDVTGTNVMLFWVQILLFLTWSTLKYIPIGLSDDGTDSRNLRRRGFCRLLGVYIFAFFSNFQLVGLAQSAATLLWELLQSGVMNVAEGVMVNIVLALATFFVALRFEFMSVKLDHKYYYTDVWNQAKYNCRTVRSKRYL